jgi:hypothetical protein
MRPLRRSTPLPESSSPVSRARLASLESEARALYTSEAAGMVIPRDAAGRILLVLAEMALHQAELGELTEARRSIEDATALLEEVTDLVVLGQARYALGRALTKLGDPKSRVMLEDAGTIFEELGDEEAVRRIDAALREAESRIEESPRSFHSTQLKAVRPRD